MKPRPRAHSGRSASLQWPDDVRPATVTGGPGIRRRAMRHRALATGAVALVALGGWGASESLGRRPAPAFVGSAQANPAPGQGGAVMVGDYLDPASITPGLVTEVGPHAIVNRVNALPPDFVPAGLVPISGGAVPGRELLLVPDAAQAWEAMRSAAAEDGIDLLATSAYRSHAAQAALVESMRAKGDAPVSGRVAVAGRSEHQTGLAVDVAGMPPFPAPVEDNERGAWLSDHAAEFGFVLRYPLGKEAETGYRYESWHWRWVGEDLARHLRSENRTMEEWAGLIPK
ncbi:M15 family metallopeptidase [Kytococcus sedentarius]|uniref:M15 family metallopeptidase n=1 Tax=Kytococcus sedentarius TaxID=1276 RepID=UPI0035BC808C